MLQHLPFPRLLCSEGLGVRCEEAAVFEDLWLALVVHKRTACTR